MATHPRQGLALHAVAETSPVIAHHLPQQFTVVGFETLGEQATAVECVLTQHALAPAVNGRYGSLVHPLHSRFQPGGAAGPRVLWIIVTQLQQQRVDGFEFTAEKPRRLSQPSPDTLAQLLGGSVCERHYQNLRRQQLSFETLLATVAEDKAQVQR